MLIDCDVHHVPQRREELLEFLDEPYRSEIARYGYRILRSGIRYELGGNRDDTVAADGRRGGTDPHWTAEQLMDAYGHRFAILSSHTNPFAGIPDPDYVAALARAYNDHTIHHWLPADERYRMGIHLPVQDPNLAVAEIERLADHPKVVCGLMPASAHRIPLGNRFYWPIYEAAARKNLPLHLHPSTANVIASPASLPSGQATNYLQSHTAHPLFFMGELISLVLEGVFERFENLKIAFVEGGVTWLAHLLSRMDKEYKGLRQEAPFLKMLPSDYVKRNCRFTTQPMEEPKKTEHLVQLFNMIDADTLVMYSSDYPHFDFDPPEVLPKQLGETTLRRILHDNACEFFNLPQPTEAERAEAATSGNGRRKTLSEVG